MSILIDAQTKVICQGFTGRQSTFHSRQALAYGTCLVGGVTPGKGGSIHLGLPVFNRVDEAVNATGATTSVIYVPAPYAHHAISEAIEAGVELIVCLTEGIPIRDMLDIKYRLRDSQTRLIGPNGPGIITPDKAKVGIIPGDICCPGSVGIVSRSGTLTYEVISHLTSLGLGQSTCVGVGGDLIKGDSFVDILKLFWEDPQTKSIVLLGEIGGDDEQKAAQYIHYQWSKGYYKPVVAFVAGFTAPKNCTMGHAGAFIKEYEDTAEAKMRCFQEKDIPVAQCIKDIGLILNYI